jgi:N-acetylglucosamine-6-sulfatase
LVGGNTYQYYNPPFQHIAGNLDDPQKIKIFHDQYTTDKVSDYAAGYLEEALRDKDVPFFVGIAPISPHSQVGDNPGPPVPAKKYSDALSNASVPRADNFNPEKVSYYVVGSLDNRPSIKRWNK